MFRRFSVLAFTLFLLAPRLARAEVREIATDYAHARIDSSTREYCLDRAQPAWAFSGHVGTAVQNIANRGGSDALGQYRELTFDWSTESGASVASSIRLYEHRPVVLFSMTSRDALPKPPAPFPAFTSIPGDLHVFSYVDQHFSPPVFKAEQNATPWLMFDDAAHSMIISPAGDFMVSAMRGDAKNSIASGVTDSLHDLPANFTHQTLIAFADGINAAWDAWGSAITDLHGKHRPANDADVGLKYLGYWTDNGAAYYYNYDPDKGYAGTLLAVRDEMRRLNIPIKYMQLDSWWYSKTTTKANGERGGESKNKKLPPGEWNRYGGLLEYKAHKDLFPDGLPAFQQQLGLPLITHNRWIDHESPYRQRYKISGVAAIDPKFWDEIGDYLKSCGIVTYEQDWLNEIYANSTEMASTVGVGDAFTDEMSRATKERGISMQYCMATPRFFLQGSKYDNLTSIRVSDDGFGRRRWNDMLYVSRMASALGEWPWVDVFKSSDTPSVLLANLSAGMVGISDALGQTNVENVMRCCRSDGVVIKPDAPIVPTDATWLADAKAGSIKGGDESMIAYTYTEHNDGIRTAYVFSYPRNERQKDGGIHFAAKDFGIAGDASVYDWKRKSFQELGNGKTFSAKFGTEPVADAWGYFIVSRSSKGDRPAISEKFIPSYKVQRERD